MSFTIILYSLLSLALDTDSKLYLTYPRNFGQTANNVVIATSFTEEAPWPSASIQNRTASQNASTCFVNVQNVVLDSIGQLWIVDSGIPYYGTTKDLIRTYVIPESLYYDGMNANDVRINNTLGKGGFAFITDESPSSSILAIDLDSGAVSRRLYNTSVGSYDGKLIYSWNGTKRGYQKVCASEQNGIYYVDTLQSEVTEEVNGVPPSGQGLVAPENYVVKVLVRSALIQHADSTAIWDGWLYFSTNQLELSPTGQYNNTDTRRGPFRSYRVFIGGT